MAASNPDFSSQTGRENRMTSNPLNHAPGNTAEKSEEEASEGKRALEALREIEKNFRTLMDQSPNMIFINQMGRVVYANQKCEEIMGYTREEFLSPSFDFQTLITPESIPLIRSSFEKHRMGQEVEPYEYSLINKAGDRIEAIITTKLIDFKGNRAILGIVTDISERKRTEEALREAKEHYRLISDNSWDIVSLHDTQMRVSYVSHSITRLLGYPVEEVLGKPALELIHPEEHAETIRGLQQIIEGSPFTSLENRIRRKDGTYIWFETFTTPLRDARGVITTFQSTSRDITERKKIEEALKESEEKLDFLSNQLINTQEQERNRVAMELHDELGQALVGLKFQLSNLQKRLRKDQRGLKDELEQTLRYLDQVTENVRRLSRDLRPTILEHFGIAAALRWLVEEFSKYYRIPISNQITDLPGLFSKEQEIIIYRIVQEALTNIGKHARAGSIIVAAEEEADRILFTVEDDGCGFDLREITAREASKRGLGLVAMEQRARMAGGTLEVRSRKGAGTRITFALPIGKGGQAREASKQDDSL
jgi:PAS domain S-box-containing protein